MENKLKLKPFSLEKAKQGKPVCTRDGRKVRFLCFNVMNENFPIIAAVKKNNENIEYVASYTKEGRYYSSHMMEDNLDLMMLSEKKEGWINLYNADTTFYYIDSIVYPCEEEAIKKAKCEIENGQREKNEYVKTVKIEWEE